MITFDYLNFIFAIFAEISVHLEAIVQNPQKNKHTHTIGISIKFVALSPNTRNISSFYHTTLRVLMILCVPNIDI